jgi:regulator of sigma E protease
MVIVSAGVIMNIILAAMLFFVLFLIGFDVPPAIVGNIQPGSPAQVAGVQVGDRIVSLDGDPQLDFTKIYLSVALLDENRSAPLEIERPDDAGNLVRKTLTIRPARSDADTRGILVLGISPTLELRGPDPTKHPEDYKFDPESHLPSFAQVRPGDVITAVGDRAIPEDNRDDRDPEKAVKKYYYVLDRALQNSNGKPVQITVKKPDGSTKTEMVEPTFVPPFSGGELDFFGMTTRATVLQLTEDSVAKGKLRPTDVITSVFVSNDSIDNPSATKLREVLDKAGQENQKVEITVLRRGEAKPIKLESMVPSLTVSNKKKGIGIGLGYDEANPVIAGIEKDSAAAHAGVPRGAAIVSINGQEVKDWHDVRRIGGTLSPDKPLTLVVRPLDSQETKTFELRPTESEIARVNSYRYTHALLLRDRIDPRRTNNPWVAAQWGVRETHDLIIQFYLTLKRMVQRSIPLSNAMGPVGIVQAGARLADRGNDWLIWFLAQISANLAVVNFLPIPIVDGGLFLFLIIEKLQGKPLSSRTQSIAQVVGLALIVSVFIFVTYQDIMR